MIQDRVEINQCDENLNVLSHSRLIKPSDCAVVFIMNLFAILDILQFSHARNRDAPLPKSQRKVPRKDCRSKKV